MGGQAGALIELTGTLRDVFVDHVLLLVDDTPHHIRIAAIAFFAPLFSA